jgi:hypothetical protein
VEGLRHGQLRDLLAIAEDPEGGIAAQHLRTPDNAGAAARVSQAIVGDDAVCGQRGLGVAQRFGQPVIPSYLP